MSVVERADVVSKDFAKQFKEKLERKQGKGNRMPLVAQADFVFLLAVAAGKTGVPREGVLKGLKKTVGCYV